MLVMPDDLAVQCTVIVATKGRAVETAELMRHLVKQTLKPANVIVAGVGPEDVEGVAEAAGNLPLLIHFSSPGLTTQRNAGVDCLPQSAKAEDHLVVFFDDDFRPHPQWLESAAKLLGANREIIGVEGTVLADGVKTGGIDEDTARTLLEKDIPSSQYGITERRASLYGCNFGLRASVFATERFDERLPLYGWLEDKDFTVRASRLGQLVRSPHCLGVHLGVTRGRISGLRFGYSQIANPIHLMGKGSMSKRQALVFVGRALASNLIHGIGGRGLVDYRGRLRGNFTALQDLLSGRLAPERILTLESK